MRDLKPVFEKIDALVNELADKNNTLEKKLSVVAEKEQNLKTSAEKLSAVERELKKREAKIQLKEDAVKLMADAKELMRNASRRNVILENKLRQLDDERKAFEKEKSDVEILQKKQMEALIKERKKHQESVKRFEIEKRVSKELKK